MPKKVVNYAPGPAALANPVLEIAKVGLTDYEGTGMSVMELSHRGPEFLGIIRNCEAKLRKLMNIPENYSVLFFQGGGTLQFSTIPLNLMGEDGSADYLVTGSWSNGAATEAAKYGKVNLVFPKADKFEGIPPVSEWKLDPKAKYVYYCANETVHGVEFPFIPETGDVPLVADMSSNILTKVVDVSKFGVIYAGAQKNIGCPGVTVVIIRKDLIGKALPSCPKLLDYKIIDSKESMLNTPPTWSIYIAGLVFNWMDDEGGASVFEKRSQEKSNLIYSVIDASDGFYTAPVEKSARSRVNVPFRIAGGNEDVEASFLKEATAQGLLQLKGHRSVGGIRASLYNAITIPETKLLADFMKSFQEQKKSN
eukprot:m.20475 g.20475  ORF g.20475 m.20475 type:complete len:366 (-) comp6853_c0_seq2:114-1211(-)